MNETTAELRLPFPLDGDCFVGMDVPLPGAWGPADVAFWTGTPTYQPWKDVAAFFRETTNVGNHPLDCPMRRLLLRI